MATLTLTEALAEIKTIGKRITKKQDYARVLIARDERIRDPLEKQGGSVVGLAAELQSIRDLEERIILLRTRIQAANHRIRVTVQGEMRSLMEWLTWRKEVAPPRQRFIGAMIASIASVRKEAQQKGLIVAAAAAVQSSGDGKPAQILVNLDEAALNAEAERLELILGELDGQLSLKNATETIEVG